MEKLKDGYYVIDVDTGTVYLRSWSDEEDLIYSHIENKKDGNFKKYGCVHVIKGEIVEEWKW